MKRFIYIVAFIFACVLVGHAQVTTKEVIRVTTDITGASTCQVGRLYYNATSLVNWERNNAGVCAKITAGGTPISGTGTTNQVSKFTSAQVLGDSGVSDSGSAVQITSESFGLTGAISGSGIFGTSGIRYKNVASTLTDTTSSGTVATNYTNVFGANTLAASSATTITNAFNTYISDPVQGTNVTLSNKWALGADSIKIGTSNQLTVSNAGAVGVGATLTGVDAVFTPANTTGNGVAINNSVLTTGNTVSITASGTAAASNTKTALNVVTSGANATSTQTTFGILAANTSTGASSTNIGGQFSASGGSTNVGLKVIGGQIYSTVNGALSTGDGPALKLDGTWITGGSATTTKPYVLIETTGATSTAWSTSGTGLGVNGASGFSGNLIDAQLNGASRFSVSSNGTLSVTTGINVSAAGSNIVNSSAGGYYWSGRSSMFAPADSKILLQNNGSTGLQALALGGAVASTIGTAPTHGQTLTIIQAEELLTIAAAPTTTTTMQVPAGARVKSISVRVTTVIPTAATFTVTLGGVTFNTTAVSTAANTTDPGTAQTTEYNSTAQGIVITPNATPGAATGVVRVTVTYEVTTPPTS